MTRNIFQNRRACKHLQIAARNISQKFVSYTVFIVFIVFVKPLSARTGYYNLTAQPFRNATGIATMLRRLHRVSCMSCTKPQDTLQLYKHTKDRHHCLYLKIY